MPVSPARTYTVEAVDLSTASDDLLREVNDLSNEMTGESIPEDPPRPVAVLARRVRNRPKMFRTRDWLARASDGRLAGRGFLARFDADTDPRLSEASIDVLAAHRRKGIGKMPFREIIGASATDGELVV